uniref:Uncharacterized protein n=1 Tax=Chrysotila carterae TaxID=13221 RepID=A0A7S4BQ60_CHRCT
MGEWGELVRTWSAAQPGSGYVRYKWRSSAQFALEAMHGRPLSPEDATPCELSWALHDPEMEMAQAGSALALRSMQEAKRRREAQQRMYEQARTALGSDCVCVLLRPLTCARLHCCCSVLSGTAIARKFSSSLPAAVKEWN